MLVFARRVLAPGHEIEEARHSDVDLLLVRVSALSCSELALPKRVVHAGLASEVVGKLAFVALGTVVLIVQLAADFLGGFGAHDLALDGVREEAVEAVLAVSHVEMNAGVEAAIDVLFAAAGRVGAFIDCEVLVRTEVLDRVEFGF